MLYEHALAEFDLLEKHLDADPDKRPLILEFKEEILALVKKFGESGQSGGSAPFYAAAISKAVRSLCMFDPIGPITGDASEWSDTSAMSNEPLGTTWQNKRLSSVFKDGIDGKSYYLDAVVFQGEDEWDRFTGRVDNVSCAWYIKSFPFTPKTFTIDVVRFPNTTDADRVSCGDGDYLYHIKDPSQLEEVRAYYGEKIPKFLSLAGTSAVACDCTEAQNSCSPVSD